MKKITITFYYSKGISSKKFWIESGINNQGDNYYKLVLPFGVVGFTLRIDKKHG